jgi:hypothetical protein
VLALIIYSFFFIFARLTDRRNLKRVCVYIVLCAFLFNIMGYYFLFELNRTLARSEMNSIMMKKSHKYIILTVPDVRNNREFSRIDKKEFRYRDHLYDVISEIKKGKTSVFLCVQDTRETNLLTGLRGLSQNKLLLEHWSHLTLLFISDGSIDIVPDFGTEVGFLVNDIPLDSSLIPTWSPPPELS